MIWWMRDRPAEPVPSADEPEPVDECPLGGEHDVVVIQPATARHPLAVYCKQCRKDFLA